jgi:hypothetical protein
MKWGEKMTDIPLFVCRYIVRKMVNQAYEAGKLFQAREDVRAVTGALKEVVNPQGLLLQQQGSRDDDCGDLVRSR